MKSNIQLTLIGGPVASGKSSQAQLLFKSLMSSGMKSLETVISDRRRIATTMRFAKSHECVLVEMGLVGGAKASDIQAVFDAAQGGNLKHLIIVHDLQPTVILPAG